ncbi:MAG: GNAT family N-acetyltransferase [Xanthomonadales bacterium]|nr:GNAT family N-acetyltransferase [Xanthomonadales bacterium]NIX13547.1 GNAT family N-acetyltransferase [Xanthomonadales bacterium]
MNGNGEQAVRMPYRIETERLSLRCWDPVNARVLREALDACDQHLRPWIPFMKDEPRTLEQTADWLRGHRANFDLDLHFRYAVWDRGGGGLLGENMLLKRVGPAALEIGYWTHESAVGRGIASEATCAMIRVAFEIARVERVEIQCAPGNEASAAIPEKLGFTHEATLKERAPDTEGGVHDLMIWSLFAADYPGSPATGLELKAFDGAGLQVL